MLQSDQKQTKPDNDKKEPDHNLFPVWHRPTDDQSLEGKQEYHDRQHIHRTIGNEPGAVDDQFHCTSIP